VRCSRHFAADLINAVHQEIEAPWTDGQCAETAGDTSSDKRPAVEQSMFHVEM
jgi:hypothetical protein